MRKRWRADYSALYHKLLWHGHSKRKARALAIKYQGSFAVYGLERARMMMKMFKEA